MPSFCGIHDAKRIGLYLFPFLENEAAVLEQVADKKHIPTENVFHDRNQNAECVLAKDRAFGNLRQVAVLGDRNRQAVQTVDVQHHMHVRAAVSDVYQMIVTYGSLTPEMIEDCHFAISLAEAGN